MENSLPAPHDIISSNISPAPTSAGLNPLETFTATIRGDNEGTLHFIMPWQWFKTVTDEDFSGIHACLQTTAPVKHQILNETSPHPR